MGADRKLCLHCNTQYEDMDLSHCPDDSTQLVNLGRDKTTEWLGKIVDNKYKLLEAVGKDSMGTVFRAEQQGTGREMAFKLLKDFDRRKVQFDEFLQRMEMWKTLRHPNILALYDFNMGKEPYMVTQFLRGYSVSEMMCRHRALTASWAVNVIVAAAEGLSAAHEKGLVHADIGPSRIMVEDEGGVKISDFAFHKQCRTEVNTAALQQYQRIPPFYRSPEDCQGRSLTFASDIYSLAIVFYEMITGKVPFKGKNVLETALMQISAPPPIAELPDGFREVMSKALEKDPSMRFGSMSEFAGALNDSKRDT